MLARVAAVPALVTSSSVDGAAPRVLGTAGRALGAPLVGLQNCTFGYDRRPAVHHVSGLIATGSLIAVCGPNGAGKSTLLKGIAGRLPPIGGRLRHEGLRRGDIALLPQHVRLDLTLPLTAQDLVAMGHWTARDKAALPTAIAKALDRVGLADIADRPVSDLSGGQLQRLLLARTIVQDAQLILLDEPFNGLDSVATDIALNIIRDWQTAGKAVLAVVHDHDIARAHFPTVLLLARHCLGWGPAAETLTPTNLARAQAVRQSWSPQAEKCRA